MSMGKLRLSNNLRVYVRNSCGVIILWMTRKLISQVGRFGRLARNNLRMVSIYSEMATKTLKSSRWKTMVYTIAKIPVMTRFNKHWVKIQRAQVVNFKRAPTTTGKYASCLMENIGRCLTKNDANFNQTLPPIPSINVSIKV